jgi:hypothetical protein
MSVSYTTSATETFTLVHARHIASKVATDLKRFQRFYGSPSDGWIDNYEAELVQLLKHNVVDNVVYGFQRNGQWTSAAVRYTALADGSLSTDDDPGKVHPNLDVASAAFTSFLSYNATWDRLSTAEQAEIRASCPFRRVSRSSPGLEAGYWDNDLTYAAGGRGLGRSSVRL